MKIRYKFSARIWRHDGIGAWHFVSLPKSLSQEIREHFQWREEGWGRMKSNAIINDIEWETAIWFDKKHDTYLLPIKSDIRKRNSLNENDIVDLTIIL